MVTERTIPLDGRSGETLVVSGQDTLAPLTGNISVRNSPWDAICTTIAIYYPAGCNGAVDVAVGHGDKKFCPEEGYIALNDTTLVLPVHEIVAMNEQLWFEVRNGDPVNAHTISVVVVLQRRSPWHSQ